MGIYPIFRQTHFLMFFLFLVNFQAFTCFYRKTWDLGMDVGWAFESKFWRSLGLLSSHNQIEGRIGLAHIQLLALTATRRVLSCPLFRPKTAAEVLVPSDFSWCCSRSAEPHGPLGQEIQTLASSPCSAPSESSDRSEVWGPLRLAASKFLSILSYLRLTTMPSPIVAGTPIIYPLISAKPLDISW